MELRLDSEDAINKARQIRGLADEMQKNLTSSQETMEYIKRRTTKMRKELKKIVEKIAIRSVTTEANATCPWASYQPKVPEVAKKLRKH